MSVHALMLQAASAAMMGLGVATGPVPVGRWDLDGVLTAQKGTIAVLMTGTEQYALGPDGGDAFDFDGSTRLQSITAAARITGDVTVACWVRTDAHSGSFQSLVLCEGGAETTATNILWSLYLTSSDSRIAWYQESGAGVDDSITSDVEIPPTQWHHIVGVREGTTVSLWVDGIRVATGTLTAAAGGTSSNVQLGANATAGSTLNGRLAKAKVYAFALTREQIEAEFGKTYTLVETFPSLAFWTTINSAARTTGVADPDGGTAAETVEDNDAGGYLGIRHITAASLAIGVRYRVTHRIKKDAITSRYPEIQHNRGSSFVHIQVDTQNGVSVVRVSSGFTELFTATEEDPDNSGWWLVHVFFTSNVAGVLQMTPLAAASTSLGGSTTAAATGAITYFPGTLESMS